MTTSILNSKMVIQPWAVRKAANVINLSCLLSVGKSNLLQFWDCMFARVNCKCVMAVPTKIGIKNAKRGLFLFRPPSLSCLRFVCRCQRFRAKRVKWSHGNGVD